MTDDQLVFVYNADGGALNAVLDSAHKLFSPSTYACSLCAITYGLVSMRGEWKAFLDRLPQPARFLHRDEFRREWPDDDTPLPAAFRRGPDGTLQLVLGAEEMNRMDSVKDLTTALGERLGRFPAG